MKTLYRILVAGLIWAGVALWPAEPRVQGQPPEGLAGEWEGSVLDPRRPYFIAAEFKQDKADGSWRGTVRVVGNRDLPAQDVTVAGGKVSFKVQLQQGMSAFEGTLRVSEIAGKVDFRGGPTDFRLTRLPPHTPPNDRAQAWQQDLETALRFTRYDRSFPPAARDEYSRRIEGLKTQIARLDDHHLMAEIAKAAALAQNGHTLLSTGNSPLARPMLPLRVSWFADGLYVIRAAPRYADTIGCKVAGVDGRTIESVTRTLAELFPGNHQLMLARTPDRFVRPDILFGMGITAQLARVTYSLECPDGARDIVLASDGAGDPDLAGVWKTNEEKPLYLRHREKNYWFEYLPETRVLYFQFNSSLNGGDETIPRFGERLLQEVEMKGPRALVVDMRFNGGGNLDLGEELFEKLRVAPKLQARNKLFVITGPTTFSAAIYHASQLRGNPGAVFVGEAVGDHLDFWAEGDAHVLPNSLLVLRSSNGYHSYTKNDPPEFRPYYRDLSISSLRPDVPARPTFKQYAEGRDVAMEAILRRLGQPLNDQE